jgi:5-methyltetrahydropteroyltriglutamate--homocysteine methyltransferase
MRATFCREGHVMRRSTERILTTHTGSLPRPAKVVEALLAEKKGNADRASLNAAVRDAVAGVIAKQKAAGIDIVNDGEQGRTDYTVHVIDRLNGFEGQSDAPRGTGEPEFPELAQLLSQFASPFQHRPACSGPVSWKDFPAVEADIARAKAAMTKAGVEEYFMTSPSPGQIARYLKNSYYKTVDEYLFTLADVMTREYRAIVEAGFILQLDCPDLAMSYALYPGIGIADYRKIISMNVEALNHSVKDLPADRMRMHVCWGSTLGPHHGDVPLKDIADIILKGKPQAVSFPGANPRHGHEWKVWKDVKLPDGKAIIPGVIDSTSNFVEHPELVADRIVQYALAAGRENVIGGADCGFGTFAGRVQVDTKIVWMKLAALAEGARLASKQLW